MRDLPIDRVADVVGAVVSIRNGLGRPSRRVAAERGDARAQIGAVLEIHITSRTISANARRIVQRIGAGSAALAIVVRTRISIVALFIGRAGTGNGSGAVRTRGVHAAQTGAGWLCRNLTRRIRETRATGPRRNRDLRRCQCAGCDFVVVGIDEERADRAESNGERAQSIR